MEQEQFYDSNKSASIDGLVYDNKLINSQILGEDRKYAIYLPPNYNCSERAYPILYLLHPAGPKGTIPNQTAWINYGKLGQFMDHAIKNEDIAPMIIVTPDANFSTKRISYFNDPDNSFNYEDFFFKEFIPYIESNYRCRTDRASRAIAGASMGGAATLFYSLHHPELFSVSCPLSSAIGEYDETYLNSRYPEMRGKNLSNWYKSYNIYELIKQVSASNSLDIAWYISCGDDDHLSPNNAILHIKMKELGIPHEFRILSGKHDWAYWRSELHNIIPFVSSHFCQ